MPISAPRPRKPFAKIDKLLAECGNLRRKLVSATIWLKSMDDYAGMNEIWDRRIDIVNPPACACGVVRLAHDHYLVKIIATAAVKRCRASTKILYGKGHDEYQQSCSRAKQSRSKDLVTDSRHGYSTLAEQQP